jgi:hypothetical protein
VWAGLISQVAGDLPLDLVTSQQRGKKESTAGCMQRRTGGRPRCAYQHKGGELMAEYYRRGRHQLAQMLVRDGRTTRPALNITIHCPLPVWDVNRKSPVVAHSRGPQAAPQEITGPWTQEMPCFGETYSLHFQGREIWHSK